MKKFYTGLIISLITFTLHAQQEANTGIASNTMDEIQNCDTEIEINTIYYGLQTITVDSVAPDTAWLRDCTRGGGVETYNMNYNFLWQNAQLINLYDNVPGASDAHFATEKVYDFYLNKYGLNSYDGNGAKMVTYINFGPSFMTGSLFNGIATSIGSGAQPLIDLIGHEFTHGVHGYAGGKYPSGKPAASSKSYDANETGALSESYCDIMGTAAEYWAVPGTFSWLFGTTDPTKYDMSDPNGSLSPVGTHYPDTYEGNYWLFDGSWTAIVHTNAAVQDYCFYLLSDGGTGTNDYGDDYNVVGIGIDHASDIFYRALTVYMSTTAQFIDSRQFTIQAAIDLFGDCSNEVEQLIHAWYAVGVGPDTYTRDLALKTVVSPVNDCDLNDEVTVELEVVYNYSGCTDMIPAGTPIEMSYQWDSDTPVVETWVLDEDFNEGETWSYSFATPINIPEIAVAYELSVWINYDQDAIVVNNSLEAYPVERKYDYDGNIMDFELGGFTNINTFYTKSGIWARAEIDTAAKHTGDNGFLMGSSIFNPNTLPEDPALNFETKPELISQLCFCVDATEWEHVTVNFDLKQTHSGMYMFLYGNDSTEFLSSMRMLVNGEQFGEQFHPDTYTDDPWVTHTFSLDQWAGTYFEFCFQSKNYVNDEGDNTPIFAWDTDGDNTYLDNILFADEIFTGVPEDKTNDFAIYPNPANDKVFISHENGSSITEVNIYNQVGQQLLHIYNPGNPLDISTLENGIYIIEIISNQSASREKLIVR
ncbi:MAG: M4 family metallopeptidase [Bacteroidales bacterium]|nr:M4 family metallopeptidase [Bacteroidales bacterium]MCF8405429.1 M4 family metallopeptidase [Bacteroidales bacterium]